MSFSQEIIRKDKLLRRRELSTQKRQSMSNAISERIITSKEYQQAQHIAVYMAMPDEVCLQQLIEHAWSVRKIVYLPVVVGKQQSLLFAPFASNSNVKKDIMRMTIPDCDTSLYCHVNSLDMVITPLVAFDDQCMRVGMGGGFYDRTYEHADSTTLCIGAAFEVQKTTAPITQNSWDRPLQAIVTEQGIYSSH